MRSFLNLLPLATLALTSPLQTRQSNCSSVADDATYASALSIVQDFKSTLDTYTAAINTTHTTYTSDLDLVTAAASYESIVSEMTTAFDSASSQVVALTGVSVADVKTEYAACIPVLSDGKKRSVIEKRQDSLTTELEAVLEELTTAISTIVGDLGLTTTLSFLDPLLSSLGGLLLSLVPVVNNLLAVVEELLDGLLIGLGTGLSGIVL